MADGWTTGEWVTAPSEQLIVGDGALRANCCRTFGDTIHDTRVGISVLI